MLSDTVPLFGRKDGKSGRQTNALTAKGYGKLPLVLMQFLWKQPHLAPGVEIAANEEIHTFYELPNLKHANLRFARNNNIWKSHLDVQRASKLSRTDQQCTSGG